MVQDDNMDFEQAFSGITVLDLSENVSAAYTAKLLGAQGARVIKIEKPGTGDKARQAGPFLNDVPNPETSALFLFLNTNKQGLTLDISLPEGMDVFKRLVKKADILVENFAPGRMKALDADYAELEKINPGLIMASVTDFGQTGPYKDYKGGRLAGNALSGYMYINGDPDKEPLAGGGYQPGYQGGVHAFVGIVAALLAREATGQGQYIDVSIQECMASLHQFVVNRYEYSGAIQKRVGNRYMYSHPITLYECSDGWISLSPSTEDQAERMLMIMGMDHLLEDPKFENGFMRLANADEFDELAKPYFIDKTRREVVELFQELRVPTAYVSSVRDLINDPQLEARGFFQTVDHPEAGLQPIAVGPYKMSETPMTVGPAPLLGQHTDQVLSTLLEMPEDEISKLKSDGII